MLHAVAEALHLTGVNDSASEGEGADAPHWSELTERDAQRLVAVGLQLNPSPEVAVAAASPASAQTAQRVRGQFCFQYIRPWEREPPVQVLRLREEVQGQSRPRSHSLDSSAIGTSAAATAVVHPRTGDSKRRQSFLSALQSPLRARTTNAVSEREDGPSSRQIATVSEQSTLSTTASPRCKVEVLTPSRSALAEQTAAQRVPALQQQQSQPPQQQQVLRTPEPIMTGKRKRVSVTISPPALPQAPRVLQAAAMPSVRSSSQWVSPKPERLLRQQQQTPREQHQQQLQAEEPQQPPLKTRRLSESGARTPSMASRFTSTLREFFKEMCGNGSEDTDPSDEVGGHESGGESGPGDDASGRESGAESDASETSSTSSTGSSSCDSSNNIVSGREFGDCDQYGGNATLLADIQDVLEPVWSLLETTSSRFQRFVVWGGEARDLSSSSAHSPPLAQKSKSGSCQSIGVAAGIVTTTELIFDGAEFEDENSEIEWTNAIEKPDKLAVRTRRQCREMRHLSTAWRL